LAVRFKLLILLLDKMPFQQGCEGIRYFFRCKATSLLYFFRRCIFAMPKDILTDGNRIRICENLYKGSDFLIVGCVQKTIYRCSIDAVSCMCRAFVAALAPSTDKSPAEPILLIFR